MFGPSVMKPSVMSALDKHLSAAGHVWPDGSEKWIMRLDSFALPTLHLSGLFNVIIIMI